MAWPLIVPALGGVVLGLGASATHTLVAAHANRLPLRPGVDPTFHLEAWPGLKLALGLSVLALALGACLAVARRPVARAQRRVAGILPDSLDVDAGYRVLLHGLRRVANRVTARVQVGSPSVYLLVVGLTVLILPGTALVLALVAGDAGPGAQPQIAGTTAEVALGVLVLAAALVVVRSRKRLAIVLVLGFVGYGVAGLLVETLTLIAFVLLLRRFPEMIAEKEAQPRRVARFGIAAGLDALVSRVGLAAAGARTATPASEGIIARAEEAGGTNVVTTILVDFRSLDTISEITVLLVAIIGGGSPRPRPGPDPGGHPRGPPDGGGGAVSNLPPDRWLLAGRDEDPGSRSIPLELAIRLLFRTILLLSVYLVFAGHDGTGGGFAGGLVAGTAFALRYVAGRAWRWC